MARAFEVGAVDYVVKPFSAKGEPGQPPRTADPEGVGDTESGVQQPSLREARHVLNKKVMTSPSLTG